jgi:hypothetical protein
MKMTMRKKQMDLKVDRSENQMQSAARPRRVARAAAPRTATTRTKMKEETTMMTMTKMTKMTMLQQLHTARQCDGQSRKQIQSSRHCHRWSLSQNYLAAVHQGSVLNQTAKHQH